MKTSDQTRIRNRAAAMLEKAGIIITPEEKANMELSDLGLGDIETMGLLVIVYIDNPRYCAKELIMFPRQTCPEHRHPPQAAGNPGKQETFRCRWGTVYFYTPGKPAARPKARIPEAYSAYFTVWHETVLGPGSQFTLPPDTPHWFQAGDEGAVVSEFSSTNQDETDIFTDPRINRLAGLG